MVCDEVMHSYKKNMIVVYNCKTGEFTYPKCRLSFFDLEVGHEALWKVLLDNDIATEETARKIKDNVEKISALDYPEAHFEDYLFKDKDGQWKWYGVGFVSPAPGELISITFTDIHKNVVTQRKLAHMSEYDEFTGLPNRHGFYRLVEQIVSADETGVIAGEYAMACFDVLRFKAVNELFGSAVGDKLILHIGQSLTKNVKAGDVVSHPGADRFMFFTHTSGKELQSLVENLLRDIEDFDVPFEIACNIGIYVTGGKNHTVENMVDRAVLAQSKIKGSYTIKYNYYTQELRENMLGEQEIVGMMTSALNDKQFVIYYQPQFSHSTGMLLGAEALVRWRHPEKGIISPGVFIPIFEKNGFITKLDMYVFEQVCAFIRKCLDDDIYAVPISTNFSRHDIYMPDFVEQLENIRSKYDVPVKYLRVEITESAVMASSTTVNQVVDKLHQYGYVVEMDDFGSGYSSLNVLKDIELDVIKLDMMFLSEQSNTNKGGTILSSIVRMAKWLSMPVIAEGVETIKQADFLRSIGCDYIQGYLYSKPIPVDEFIVMLKGSTIGEVVPQMRLIDTLNSSNFWDPMSQETLIFSNYVGAAAIFDYHNGRVELLRVNQKYLREIGMSLSERELMEMDLLAALEEGSRLLYEGVLERAISTMEEQECEVWYNLKTPCCEPKRICISANVRLIGKSDDSCLFYATIRNVTDERNILDQYETVDKKFRLTSEQVNIYTWEYDVATRDMRPCFRCIRDLGLPPLVRNYPEPSIEMGIFPPDYADMVRDWHRQIEAGVVEIEAVIPLTKDRIPFRIRYTTEFDKAGNPVKAYGSATLVKEE